MDPSEIFTFHTCSTIARLLFGDLVGIWGAPGWRQGFGGGSRDFRGDPGVCGGDIQLFGGTEQFAAGWQGFRGTQEFEGTQVSGIVLRVFRGIQRELEYWAVHRCVLFQVPPPGELRAFSRCLGELLQVWGHSSVQVLDLLPLLRVSLAGPKGGLWPFCCMKDYEAQGYRAYGGNVGGLWALWQGIGPWEGM